MARVVLPIHHGDGFRGCAAVEKIQRKVGATVDGLFGPDTERHVRDYQRAHKLKVDGIVGKYTWGLMFPITAVVSPPVVIIRPPVPQPATGRLQGVVIINDVGHGVNNTAPGRYDPGACAGGLQEHRVVEEFVAALSAAQRAQGAIVTVSQDVALRSRKAVASADATSYHLNAGGGHGVEVLVPWFAGSASRAKSDRIGRAVATALELPYRGTKRTTKLAVLNRGFDRLVELAFLDNAVDRGLFAAKSPAAIEAIVANV